MVDLHGNHEKSVPYGIKAKDKGIIIFTVGANDSIQEH